MCCCSPFGIHKRERIFYATPTIIPPFLHSFTPPFVCVCRGFGSYTRVRKISASVSISIFSLLLPGLETFLPNPLLLLRVPSPPPFYTAAFFFFAWLIHMPTELSLRDVVICLGAAEATYVHERERENE